MYSSPALWSSILCMCYLVFNRLKWAPQISGAFLCILPLLYSAPQYPAALASPKYDLSPELSSTTILCLSPLSLCCYLKSTSQQNIRVILVLTSFVFPPTGSQSCAVCTPRIQLFHLFYPVFYLFTVDGQVQHYLLYLGSRHFQAYPFYLIPSHVHSI